MTDILLTILACAGMISIVPLMVLGGTGSWRHAWHAFKQYVGILLGFVVVGCGLALIMALADWL